MVYVVLNGILNFTPEPTKAGCVDLFSRKVIGWSMQLRMTKDKYPEPDTCVISRIMLLQNRLTSTGLYYDSQSFLLFTPDPRCGRQHSYLVSSGDVVAADQCADDGYVWRR